jgi:acyl-CoA synthetase (AMP-forming)/AMP-acid ligase II
MPLYHTSAAILGFCSSLSYGITLIIGHRFSNKTFWQDVRTHNATIIQYVGETCRYLLAAPPQLDPSTGENLDHLNKVRIAFGNGMRPDVWDKFKARFDIPTIAEFYASTEGTASSWNLSTNSFAAGAVGRNGTLAGLLLGPTVAIVALDYETELPYRDPTTGLCKKLQRGEPGELLGKIDAADIEAQFQGYLNNDKASSSKIMRDVLAKGDAWFRTGDVLRWDSDGRWYFSDRIGDTFRWKSENVSTNEVSEVLGHFPQIHEANVYGVEVPHHDGRAGCACVVFSSPEPPSSQTMTELASYAGKNLPKYAMPLFVRVTREMQATGNNKQQKHVLRSQGVDPEKVGATGDILYWLQHGEYRPYGEKEWKELNGGRVKL